MKIAKKIELSKCGRKDVPPSKNWYKIYEKFPIGKLEIGNSFSTGIDYEYGRTISIKNSCRSKARKLNMDMKFSVREWKGKIRVWRIA